MLTAVTGINWGDEGKGRVIDLLAEQADVVVRYQGGNNAGHTVVTTQGKFVLNLLPSGILHPGVVCVLGDGMVVDLEHLSQEIHEIEKKGIRVTPDHLKLSKRATVSMPWHKVQDELEENRLAKTGSAFGSTRRGIAYAYANMDVAGYIPVIPLDQKGVSCFCRNHCQSRLECIRRLPGQNQ